MTTETTQPDPPGTHFQMYGNATPEEPWEYELDDYGVSYGPGLWPFHYAKGEAARDPRCVGPRSVRVAPDTAYQSWDNEYVLLGPEHDGVVDIHLLLYVRPQGRGHMVCPAYLSIDLASGTIELPSCPSSLADQAQQKASKLWPFLQRAQREAAEGISAPTTAHPRWLPLAEDGA